jgi:HEAT repeat protein
VCRGATRFGFANIDRHIRVELPLTSNEAGSRIGLRIRPENHMRLLSLLTLLLLAPAVSAQKPEPKYEGKPLSYWLEKFQKAETDEQRQNAASIVCAFGPDAVSAVPLFVEMLHDHSPVYRSHVERMFVAVGPAAKGAVPDLIKMLEANPPRAAREVCTVLCAIGPDAKPALPAIRKLLLEQTGPKPVSHGIELFALHNIGPESAPLLAEAVERNPSSNYFTVNGLMGLAKLGSAAKAAAPKVKPLLKSESANIRLAGASALWALEENVEAIPVLMALIDEEQYAMAAVGVLGRIGPAAIDALPKLKPLVSKIMIATSPRRPGDPLLPRDEFQDALREAIRLIEAKPK